MGEPSLATGDGRQPVDQRGHLEGASDEGLIHVSSVAKGADSALGRTLRFYFFVRAATSRGLMMLADDRPCICFADPAP
ncbi:hypothetical protein NLS1_18120 [Nocardioides sp. LS1]|nr:hypothetical protein NLS1_18120 [Nocardioides sp. LS1]